MNTLLFLRAALVAALWLLLCVLTYGVWFHLYALPPALKVGLLAALGGALVSFGWQTGAEGGE